MKDNFFVSVAKVYVVKDHAALQLPVGNGPFCLVGMLPGPQIGAYRGLGQCSVLVFFCIDQFHIALVLFRLLIHQVEDTLGSGRRIDHEIDLLADLGDGVGKALVQSHEGYHSTDGHAGQSVDPQDGAHNGHQGVTDPADVGIDGHQQVGVAVGLVGAVSELFIDLMEIFHGRLLVAEDLDHLLAVSSISSINPSTAPRSICWRT